MRPTGAPVQTRPERAVSVAPRLRVSPRRLPLSELRKLRDRLHREGEISRALQAASQVAEREPGRESYFNWGALQREAGHLRESLDTLRDALRFKTGPSYLVPEIHVQIASAWYGLGQRKRMAESLKRAYRLRPKPRTAPKFHHSLGSYYMSRRRFREAAEEFARAEAAYSDGRSRGRAAMDQALVHVRLQEFDRADGALDRAYPILKNGGHRRELAGVTDLRGVIQSDRGHYGRALELHCKASRVFRHVGDTKHEVTALCSAGYAAIELGLWPRSRALLSRAIRIAAAADLWLIEACSLACRAIACACDEDFDQATRDLSDALKRMKGRWNWIGSLHVYRAQARIAALFGDWVQAKCAARRAERLASKAGDLPRIVEFRSLRGRAEEALGRTRAAAHARKSAAGLKAIRGGRRLSTHADVAALSRRLAATDLPVLITGESGTGKTRLARRMHEGSRRRKGPCVVVPCEQLVFAASELGGHAKGAWTSARNGSPGYVRSADGGTLILDRIDELSASDQRILLRMVDGEVRPVGEAREKKVDLRVLATCLNTEKLIPELRSRLSGACIALPPLREKPSQVALRVRALLEGRRRITCDALALLARRPWPGNEPELESVVERLVGLSRDAVGVKLVNRVLGIGRSARRASRARRTALALG